MEEYSHNLKKNLEDLETGMEKLNAIINELSRRVLKEKARGIKTLPKLQEWISTAEETESKASSLLDESISGYHDLSTYDGISKISESTLHYSKMVCMMLKEVGDVRSDGEKVLVERTPLSYLKKMLPLQPIFSRKILVEKAWKCLMGNECRTLGLYGMAGVGKTTLLTQLKNKFTDQDENASRVVIFVLVEPEEEVEGIQHEIGKILGLSTGRKDKQEKATEIFKNLNVKRFVLLLDGIHRKVDLEEIGVPQPTRGDGCKIVFTTSSHEICKRMRVDTEAEVKCLSPEEAWDFFQEIVGKPTLKSHPDIPQLARIVAKKCGGLPVALSLIGETMSHKRTVREWHHAIHVLVSSKTQFSGTEAELLPILKLTYDNLHGETIRSCFLYCALFPKSCDISKQDLVDCWIAEGMIEEENREIAEIKGYEMIADLVMLRLLIDDESGYGVTMHGMVRKMALWIASDYGRQKENFVTVGGMGIHKMPQLNDWSNVRRMSVTSTQVTKISDSPDSPELKTLFLQENNLKWVSGDFFRWMTSLVVLNLSRNRELSELPEEVSSLVSLRLLNLSWTKIKRLPLGLKELKRLIHLDLDDTPRLLEVDVIRYLLKLQVLRLLRSVPMDLSLLENIQLLKNLKELNLIVRDVDVLKRLTSIHELASCIRHLHLRGITINDGETLLLNSMLSLRELNIGMCDIPTITVNWTSIIQRERVHFGNIPVLRNVRTVTLSWCAGLRDLTWLLLAPSLADISLLECQQIEHIINKEKATADMSEQPFRNLTRLSLDSLPRLESIYWTPLPFPVLEDLCIRGCPKLRRLPFNSNSAKGNQVRSDLDKEWIKGVEWEDEVTKQHFSYFHDRDFPKMAEEQNMDNIALVETSETGKNITANSITDFDDRDFRKMDGLASESHLYNNIDLVETSEGGKSTTANSITDFDDRDFPTMAEDHKMDGLASESHPIKDIVLVETLESGKGITADSITRENVFQSGTHATMERTQTYQVLTPDGTISDRDDTPGTIMDGGLLSFEIQKLWDLISQEFEQFEGAMDQINRVKKDLHELKFFLEDANDKKHKSGMVRYCVEEIKEIVFDAEDMIETYLLKKKPRKTGGIKRLVRRVAGIIPEFASDMNGISMRISKITRIMETCGVQQVIIDGECSQALLQRQKEMRQEFAGEYKPDLVGLEENVKKLVSYLVEEDNIQVVSITGMGGLGKTTLARQTFNHDMVKNKFDRFAWVCVSRVCDRMSVWQTILRSLMAKGDECEILGMTESELQEQIFLLLEVSKSLIVIDDICKEEDWEQIRPILPYTKGWKVLLTSRNDNVVRNDIHINFKPKVLTFEDSWTLFQTTVFPGKDAFGEEFEGDEEMEEMGKHMIRYCGGLPLAVRVLGGLLAGKYTPHAWKRISKNVRGHLMGRTVYHVMYLSFEELPGSLKHCFLCLAIFPEKHRISVEKLSYYWAAEGFTNAYYDDETIRDVGDSYIEELSRRNMVTSERDRTSMRFETCHMHDIMREMCLSKAEEENFLQIDVIHSTTARFHPRRFVCQNTTTLDVERYINNPKLRSFLVILDSEVELCRLSGLRFTRLQLLRVLDLDKARFEGRKLPSDIGKLIRLRYLSLEAAEVSHLPSSLRNLKLLIYLNIDVADIDIHVPNVLMEMQKLRYLALPRSIHEKTKLELSNLVNLETLKNFSTKNSSLEDLRCMTRLRTLSINVSGETSSETLSLSIGGLRNLESLVIHDRLSWIKEQEGIVLDFNVLKNLELFMYRPVNLDNERFPSHLTCISLTECRFEDDPMPILERLQHLRKVKLLDRSHCGRRMVCSRSGFPQLRELELVLLEQLEEWIIEEGSMPLLHTLDITNCNKLKELPDGLRFITSLKDLTCYSMGKEWEVRLWKGGEEYYKVQHIPSVKFYRA